MTAKAVTIFLDPDHRWAIGAIDGDQTTIIDVDAADDAARELAGAISQSLRQHNLKAAALVLALPSEACFAARIDDTRMPRRNRGKMMLYQLEEKLPLDAEELAADFIPCGDAGSGSLGICTRIPPLKPLIESLEHEGFTISAVCPTALLALTRIVQTKRDSTPDAYLLQTTNRLDLLVCRDQTPTHWYCGQIDSADAAFQLRHVLLGRADPLVIQPVGVETSILEQLHGMDNLTCLDAERPDIRVLATEACHRIAVQGQRPPIDLRRGQLAPRSRVERYGRPLLAAYLACLFMLVAITGVAVWRAHRYQTIADRAIAKQQTNFHAAFPDQQTPLDVLDRLRSEVERLKGLHGEADHTAIPEQVSALKLLHDALANLPVNLRYRILDLRLDQDELYMNGQARAHGDADTIAAGLRRSGDYQIDPPRTENLQKGKGVSFTITGNRGDTSSS